jgi:hypothetical protein
MIALHTHYKLQQIRQTDTVEHLGADAIEHREADAGSVLGGIDVHPERPLAEGRMDTCTIAPAKAEASASGGTKVAKAFCTYAPTPT